ncbi:MAG: Glycerol-3-phosphate dehydrogenase [Armatimonadetes bacterium]|jgi:glycerol-3-phosphate dehydrogenase (NAD(P)+)|nr:Glycerol-3-phosphate dehydrogenase [Armatimonadota bacterium]
MVAVLGGGSWGTVLAWVLGGKGIPVRLWFRDAEQAELTARTRRNERYVPDLDLPAPISPTADFAVALEGAGLVVVAVPTAAVRATLERALPLLPADVRVLLAAKGLERGTGLRPTEVAGEALGAARSQHVAVLSGPNLAGELVQGMPTATVIAGVDEGAVREMQQAFSTATFRVYTNPDVIGVELGGALKNPIAIAAGISDGLGYGNNTKATLLTRGLAEMTRLGVAAGALPGTFSGLSGLGDLLATAHSPLSRNYRVGLALGRGDSLPHAQESLHQVAEGVPTTEAACRLAEKLCVESPIVRELYRILYEGAPPAEAVGRLMSRPHREEGEADWLRDA